MIYKFVTVSEFTCKLKLKEILALCFVRLNYLYSLPVLIIFYFFL